MTTMKKNYLITMRLSFFLFFSLLLSGCKSRPDAKADEVLNNAVNQVNFQQQMSMVARERDVSRDNFQKRDTVYNILWESTEHDFGQVKHGEVPSVLFTFHVVSGEARITGSRTFCGCTVPGWDPRVLGAGESYSIMVKFNTNEKSGYFTETVELFFNGSNNPERLTVRGFIVGGQ